MYQTRAPPPSPRPRCSYRLAYRSSPHRTYRSQSCRQVRVLYLERCLAAPCSLSGTSSGNHTAHRASGICLYSDNCVLCRGTARPEPLRGCKGPSWMLLCSLPGIAHESRASLAPRGVGWVGWVTLGVHGRMAGRRDWVGRRGGAVWAPVLCGAPAISRPSSSSGSSSKSES